MRGRSEKSNGGKLAEVENLRKRKIGGSRGGKLAEVVEVFAARKRNAMTARARKKKHCARMLANVRKD